MRILILILALLSLAGKPAEDPVRVGVIDTGLDLKDPRFISHLCQSGHRDFTGEGLRDIHSHGSHVAGLIVKYAENANYCLVIYKYYSQAISTHENMENEVRALKQAVKDGVNIVNLSTDGIEVYEPEYLEMKFAQNIKFVVAAGNNANNMDLPGKASYPGYYRLDNIIAVGSLDDNKRRSSYSNYGQRVKSWEIGENVLSTVPGGTGFMSGTSQATAIKTGKMVLMMSNERDRVNKVRPTEKGN